MAVTNLSQIIAYEALSSCHYLVFMSRDLPQ